MKKKNFLQNQTVMVPVDIIMINLAFFFSYVIRYQWDFPYAVPAEFYAPFWPYLPYALVLTLISLLMFKIDGLYENVHNRRWLEEAYRLFTGTMSSIVLTMALTFALQPDVYSRGMLLLAGILIVIILSVVRLIRFSLVMNQRRRGIGVQRVLIVGLGEVGRAVARNILADPWLGYKLVGYVDDDPAKGESHLGRIKGLGDLGNLSTILTNEDVNEVIVTLPWMYHRKIIQIIESCEQQNIRVRVVPDVFQQRMRSVDVESLGGIPLIGPETDTLGAPERLIKRVIDLAISIVLLPFILLFFLFIGLAIKLESRGPIIFKHHRVGKDGGEFYAYKFRSMIDGADRMQASLQKLNEAEGPLFKIKDDPRLTRVGKFIRKTSIDEIPQFFNVLKGDMSLVGPRPGTPDEVKKYEPWQEKRLTIRPGITGIWQTSGRSDVPFDEMCLLDIYYIENWSLDLDIRILLQTIPHVISRKGAY